VFAMPRIFAICANCVFWSKTEQNRRRYYGQCTLHDRATGRTFSCCNIMMSDDVAVQILEMMDDSGAFPEFREMKKT